MKKGTVSFLSIVGTLTVLSGVAAGLYYGSKKVREATDGLISSIKGDSSLNPGTSEFVSDSSGALSVLLPQGRRFANASLNDVKTVVATITPANATIKTIVWATADPAKIALGSVNTESGASQTLKLVKYFDGTVAITCYPLVNADAKVTFTVSVDNFALSMTFAGIYCSDDITDPDLFLWSTSAGSSVDGGMPGDFYLGIPSANHLVYFAKAGDQVGMGVIAKVVSATGVALPISYYGSFFGDNNMLNPYAASSFYCLLPIRAYSDTTALSSTAGTKSWTLGKATLSLTMDAYVAAASIGSIANQTF